jgi:hypothetical protein
MQPKRGVVAERYSGLDLDVFHDSFEFRLTTLPGTLGDPGLAVALLT